jgi:regulator of sigma E protease
VEREGKPVVVDLALDPRDAAAFLRAVAFVPKEEKGMAPVSAPRRHLVDGDRIRRYDRWAAIEAGIVTGDRIVQVGDEEVADVARVAAILDDAKPEALSIVVEGPDGARRTLSAKPASLATLAGVKLDLVVFREPVAHGIGDAMGVALARTGREVVSVFRQIGALFSGRIAFDKSVAGPITLVSMSGRAAEASWLHLLWFLAFISVTLAVLNVLPIPLLDGGHLLYLLIEKLKGSPLKEATIAKLQWIGLILLLTLMVFALKNDFASL